MIDPTKMNEDMKPKKAKNKLYGKTFLWSMLGGIVGGVLFLGFYGFLDIVSFPLLLLSGVGAYVFYLYFIHDDERNSKQVIFQYLSLIVSVLILMLVYLMIAISKQNTALTMDNLFDAYFHNQQAVFEGVGLDYTLFMHIVAYLFSAIGMVLTWVYVIVSVPRWEKKHGGKKVTDAARMTGGKRTGGLKSANSTNQKNQNKKR